MHNSTSGFRIEDVVRSTMQKPSEDYLKLGDNFGNYHKDPANVLLHFVSTPLGLIGAISLLRTATNSSSVAMSAVFLYLLSLLPIVPNGDFYGTAIFCALILLSARLLKLGTVPAISLIMIGYVLQDLSHLATGESTFQSTYSDGGSVSIHPLLHAAIVINPQIVSEDLPAEHFYQINTFLSHISCLTSFQITFKFSWLWDMLEHVYYLLPLCVHVALPLLILPSWVKDLLNAPMPIQMQQLHVWGWLLTPLIVFVLGSYCLDSKNSFCFFPGTPYFHRVLRCDMTDVKSGTGKDAGKVESRQADLELIRDWAMSLKPDECKSTHWWYADLDKEAKSAFDRCVHSTQVEEIKLIENYDRIIY